MRRKPDEVISVRFELQDKERELFSKMLEANTIKEIVDGIDKLASFENLYIIVTVLELVTGREILPGTPNDIYALIDALRNFLKEKNPFSDPGNPDATWWEAFWDVNLRKDFERFFGGDDD